MNSCHIDAIRPSARRTGVRRSALLACEALERRGLKGAVSAVSL